MSNPTDGASQAPGTATAGIEPVVEIVSSEADMPRGRPDIASIHRDLTFANAYRQEFIKSLILMAGALLAFSVSFRPELRQVDCEGLFWLAWMSLAVSLLGGFCQLAMWERFYSSYQRYEWKHHDGKTYRDVLTAIRRLALCFQVAGFIVGVAALGSFTAINLANVEKSKPAGTAPGAPTARP